MTFEKAQTSVPEEVLDISIELFDDNEGEQKAKYSVQVRYSDGQVKIMTGDLVPHNTSTQNQTLIGFMVAKRLQAELEILP